MNLLFRVGVVVLVLAFFSALTLAAQTGTVAGVVSDSTGAPLAGAAIEVVEH